MATYLITGGAGFIGSNLAETLLKRGNNVFSIDNLSTGSMKNIEDLRLDYPRKFTHYTASIEESDSLLSELIDLSDVVYHLAAAVGVKTVVEKPTHTLKTNFNCTDMVLERAEKKGKKTIITSTSEVYGKSNEDKFREDSDVVIGPSSKSRWCYSVSKLSDEHLALAYYKEKKLPVVVLRLFNTVGPKQTGFYGMVIPRFIEAALKNEDLVVYGDGTQSRCFSYIDDVVDALIKVSTVKEAEGGIYNVGSTEEISIMNLAEKIKSRLNSSSKITTLPYELAYTEGFEDMRRRVPDISKINELIGWKPTTSLEETIDKTAVWIRKNKL